MISYFAFGSNMHIERLKSWGVQVNNPRSGRLKGYKTIVGVQDNIYTEYGFISIIPAISDAIEGVIFETNEKGIEILDDYEGYPDFYTKENIEIMELNGELTNCVVYIGQPAKIKEGLKLSKEQKEHILKGKSFLTKTYFQKLTEFIS